MAKTLILDTNVIHNAVSKRLQAQTVELLNIITKDYPKLTISEYTVFEIYRGLGKEKIPKVRELVNGFDALGVDSSIIKIAAALYSCYQNYPSTKSKKYEDGDVIIGATSLRYNTPILTANGNDFPRPFFTEVSSHKLKRAGRADIVVQILQPDIKVFNDTVKDCLK